MTLNQVILLALRRADRVCVKAITSWVLEFALDDIPQSAGIGNHVRGAAAALQQRHVLHTGIDGC